MNSPASISIITVNYNGLHDTCELIDSLRRHVTTPVEIIVVDNASERDEAAILQNLYPEIIALRSPRNLGFAGGNNLGAEYATTDYLLFINNDTTVEDDSLKFLVDRMESDSRIGAVSPKIKFAFEPRNIQFAGYTPMSRITLRNALIGFDTPDAGQYNTPGPMPYLHGAAMMVRREAIKKAGPMPEIYFLYYEELDWCEKIRTAGYTLWYEPLATVYHKESRSTGAHSPLRTRYMTRNRLLFAYRNRQASTRTLSILYQLAVAIPKNYLQLLLSGHKQQSTAILRGVSEFIKLKNRLA